MTGPVTTTSRAEAPSLAEVPLLLVLRRLAGQIMVMGLLGSTAGVLCEAKWTGCGSYPAKVTVVALCIFKPSKRSLSSTKSQRSFTAVDDVGGEDPQQQHRCFFRCQLDAGDFYLKGRPFPDWAKKVT